MELKECVMKRRSVRCYQDQPILSEDIYDVLQSAIWAPSGKNYQPWKFVVVQDIGLIHQISEQSIYCSFMQQSAAMIVVFLDREISYDDTKDKLAVGAAIENILLTCTDKGIGTCWIGEILKNQRQVNEILGITNQSLELMAVITMGYPAESPSSTRKDLSDFLLDWR